MDFQLYQCAHCGNIAYKAYDSGNPLHCCGTQMETMKANTTDGAREKHVPLLARDGETVTVTVGSVFHPMVEEHYIPLIAAVGEDSVVFKKPKPGQAPLLTATLEGKADAYAWCNLHGLWKGE